VMAALTAFEVGRLWVDADAQFALTPLGAI
jgi:hypothetical protein